IPKDTTDRNRTSPFAFTGNKFEFRSVGSALSISGPNVVLNTVIAKELDDFATELEGAADFNTALTDLIKRTISEHKRIIFNGNGYDEKWVQEAEARGLLNLRTLPDAMEHYLDKKNIDLYTKYGVYTKNEMKSHHAVKLEKYSKILNIEVNTMLDMIYKDILPAAYRFMNDAAETVLKVKQAAKGAKCAAGVSVVKEMSERADALAAEAEKLAKLHDKAVKISDEAKQARFYADEILAQMAAARAAADAIEPLLGEKYKPYPSYADLLFSV
ncbi:MAG: glutamine synthetase type III, partial [Treponemataceae bacterium]|nr:glutamine synthetase type III [Treponemataceae bacterium]